MMTYRQIQRLYSDAFDEGFEYAVERLYSFAEEKKLLNQLKEMGCSKKFQDECLKRWKYGRQSVAVNSSQLTTTNRRKLEDEARKSIKKMYEKEGKEVPPYAYRHIGPSDFEIDYYGNVAARKKDLHDDTIDYARRKRVLPGNWESPKNTDKIVWFK